MCLTCGGMDAPQGNGRGQPHLRGPESCRDENHRSGDETVDIVTRTLDIDHADHPSEYAATARVS